jgi:hypothetical protein
MLKDTVNQLKARKTAIRGEIATLNAEDRQIDRAIEAITNLPATTEGSVVAPVKATKRTISAATKAKMKAAQQARWAKINAPKAPVAVPAEVATPAAKPAKKKQKAMSPLGKLRIKLGSLNRYGKKAEAKKVQAQIAALEAKSK